MATDLNIFMATMVGSSRSVPPELAEKIVREQYGLHVVAERLTGERDENFKVTATDGTEYVFKVANAAEDPSVTDLPTAALVHMETVDPSFPCPRVHRDRSGHTQVRFNDHAELLRTARLVTYLPGRPLQSASRSAAQRAACGRMAARLGRALRSFEHPASHRTLVWDLRNVPKLRMLLDDLPSLPCADFIADFIARFEARVEPRLACVRHQFVHNDFNARNILVDPADESVIAGIIDFGDSVHTALIADVAIAAGAQITDIDTAGESVADLVRAYRQVEPLLAAEMEILNWLIAARIVTGVLIPSWHRARNPSATHYDAFDADHIRARVELASRLMTTQIK